MPTVVVVVVQAVTATTAIRMENSKKRKGFDFRGGGLPPMGIKNMDPGVVKYY